MQHFKMTIQKLTVSALILLSSCLAFSAGTYIQGPALIEGFTAVTSAAGTTTLTVTSQTKQILTGTSTQTFVLPDATTIPLGRRFYVINKSTGTATVNANGGSLVATVLAGQQKEFHLRAAGSAAGTWDATRILVDGANDILGVIPVANGGTGLATLTSGNVLIGNGTGNVQFVAPGADGTALVVSGGVWTAGTVSGAGGGGTGDVTGVASSVSGEAVIFNSTSGKSIGRATGTGIARLNSGVLGTSSGISAATEISGAVPLANGGTNANITASHGGLAYSTASAISIGPVGTSGQIATSTGAGAPSWVSQVPLANGGTNANITASHGGLAYSTASAISIGPVGSSGQIPRSAGAGSYTWSTATYPATAGTANNVLTSDGANWVSASAPSGAADNSYELTNLGLATSVSGSALTIALKQKDGSDPAAGGSAVKIAFRNSTAATGQYSQVSVTSALSLTVSSGSTLGTTNGDTAYLAVYALNNAGSVELAVIGQGSVDEGSLQTTTAEGGAGAADSAFSLYSTTARSNVAVRLIGRIKISESTAGTWASNATEVSLSPFQAAQIGGGVRCASGNGYGSTNTAIRKYSSCQSYGTAVTYASSSTNGDTFTINQTGIYCITIVDGKGSAGNAYMGASVNSTQLTTSIASITDADAIFYFQPTSSDYGSGAMCRNFDSGDVIRAHGLSGGADRTTGVRFSVIQQQRF